MVVSTICTLDQSWVLMSPFSQPPAFAAWKHPFSKLIGSPADGAPHFMDDPALCLLQCLSRSFPVLPLHLIHQVRMATSEDGNGAALPSGKCCCRRHDHCDPSTPAQAVAQNAEDVQIWKTVLRFYQTGFVELVTRRRPCLAEWAARLRRWTKQPKRRPVDGDFGYRINFADMQRMHMRRLQAKLINVAMAIQFDNDKGVKGGAVESLGLVLHDYGKSNPTVRVPGWYD